MADEMLKDESEFVAAVKVREKFAKAKEDSVRKLKAINLKILDYMKRNDLKAKRIDIDGRLTSIAKIQSTSVTWEEEKCREFLEPMGLWKEVVEIRSVFNPELIAKLVDENKITEEEASKMATVKENEPYIKVTAIKEAPAEIHDE